MALLDDAATWLPDQIQIAAQVTVTYTRKATSATLTAVVGQIAFVADPQTGARIEVADRDFFILVDDFEASAINNPETPQKGDRIQESGSAKVYEILDTNTGEPAWRYTDPTETEFRIHTKRVT